MNSVDEVGVSLARVAAGLGVRSPSLYSHVDGLAGLRRALSLEAARRLGSALADAARGVEGTEALRAVATAYRSFATDHPGLYAALLPAPVAAEDEEAAAVFAEPVQTVAAILGDMGLADAEMIPLIRALRSTLHGFASLELGGGFGLPYDLDASFDMMIDVFVAGLRARTRSRRLPL